ncbi:MAG TPA: TonB-dependent receptor [Bryobacteraceae bacterium]|nr:TonB-dependent receptor [Bryobacteraceae bacterium]
MATKATTIAFIFLVSSIGLSVGVSRVRAQGFQAQINGVVKDPSGAVIPGAKLTATDLATNTAYSAAANQDGIYHFADLVPARYRVTCSVSGFKTFDQSPVTLQVNQVLELDVTLQPGQTTERVTVTAEAPPLDTQTASVSTVVTTRSIQNLPLNVRDPLALVGLTAGVVFGPNFGNGGGNASDVGRNFFKSDFNVGGGRSGYQEILLDGAPDETSDINRGVIDPPVDSVQEFSVQANSFDAAFGRTSGSIVNIILKSGTNDYHGVAYDFERHSVLDANNFFNNLTGQPKVSFQRHQFGGNVGGRIIKNKWFFFADYEGLRQAYPNTTIDTVPTVLQRQGNFSQTYASNGSLITIYDPASVVLLNNGTYQRTPFTNNTIPANRFNPVAVATLAAYPLPNTAGNPLTNQNNYVYSADSITNSNKYDLRTDYNFTDETRMFVRFSRQQDVRIVPGNMPDPIGGGRDTNDHYTQAVADLTHVFSASVVGDIQTSFTRALASQYGTSLGFNLTSLNLPASYAAQVGAQFPAFNISDVTGTDYVNGPNGGDDITQFQPRNVFATKGSISYQRGRHSLKFGGDWRVLDFNEGQNTTASGSFAINRAYTQGPNAAQASTTSGYGVASFLLGDASSGSVNLVNPISTQGLYYAAFVQDDWKVSDKLTLNIGLRWDVAIGDHEKYNRIAYFDPNAISPLAAPANLPNLRGDLVWLGQGNPQNQQATDWTDFGPRFGLAYKLTDKTVIRGGYGIFYLPKTVQANGAGAIEAVRTTSMVASLNGNITPSATIDNPFPQGLLPSLNDRNPDANVGSTISTAEYPFKNAYSQLWNFGIERELGWGIVLNGYYWGSKSTRLLETWNLDQVPDQYLALGSRLNSQVANPFYGVVTTGALTGKTISLQQSLLPFPQYTQVTEDYVPAGNSTYEAGTIQAEKRLSSYLTFLTNYTRSKAIDDVRTPIDVYNRRLEKSLSSFDVPNMFRFSGVYNIPFGRDRAHGKDFNRVVTGIFGDWDLDGIVTIQSGEPVSISRTALNKGLNPNATNPSIYQWFNTSDFTVAPAFTYGNVGPVLPTVFTDGVKNLDTVLVKNFSVTISDRVVTAQFRSEFYNVFNHPLFAAPNGSITSQSFGTITAQANTPRDIQFGLKIVF